MSLEPSPGFMYLPWIHVLALDSCTCPGFMYLLFWWEGWQRRRKGESRHSYTLLIQGDILIQVGIAHSNSSSRMRRSGERQKYRQGTPRLALPHEHGRLKQNELPKPPKPGRLGQTPQNLVDWDKTPQNLVDWDKPWSSYEVWSSYGSMVQHHAAVMWLCHHMLCCAMRTAQAGPRG